MKAALANLENVSETDSKAVENMTGAAALGGLSTGGTDGAILAGIAAAPTAFEAAGKDIVRRRPTLVKSVVNSMAAVPAKTAWSS